MNSETLGAERNHPGATEFFCFRLLAEFQLFRDGLVAADVCSVQIIQQTAALADHHQQPAARAVVFCVFLEMLGKMIDALGEQRNLHIRRTSIPFVQLKIFDCLSLSFHTLFRDLIRSSLTIKKEYRIVREGCKGVFSEEMECWIHGPFNLKRYKPLQSVTNRYGAGFGF